jgi:lactate dehydrogenase (NAD+,ferredoxin) subunit LctD
LVREYPFISKKSRLDNLKDSRTDDTFKRCFIGQTDNYYNLGMVTSNPITQEIYEKLESIVGAKNVIGDMEKLEPYSYDETLSVKCMPDVVVKPENTEQVSKIMKLAYENKIPVTPRGAGTGLSAGAVPVCKGIVLSTENFNRILEIDEQNLMAVTQPAVITADLQKAAEEKGLFYPPDPASIESCSIGGNVAENAGGPRAFKYGVTGKYLCGLEVVWPNGDVSRLGGKLIKNVAGYDILGLICGSEGTLAIVTEIILQLIPKPEHVVDLLIPFPSIEKAVTASTKIIQNKIVPTTMEFMDKKTLRLAENLLEKEAPLRDAEAHLLVQLDGQDKGLIQKEYEKIGEVALEYGADDILVAEDKSSADRLWEMRRCLADALVHKSPVVGREDVAVPRAKIPEIYSKILELEKKHGIEIIAFGHIGDGNVHANFLKNDIPNDVWEKKIPVLMQEFYQIVVDMGGTITGEHGVGITKKKYLCMNVDPYTLELMKAIKKQVDPHGILNPKKIFDC